MHTLVSHQTRRRFQPLWLLALLGVAGQGCGLKATSPQYPTGKVTELTGVIGERHHYGDMAFSPDGKTLVLPNWDGTVALWDLKTGKADVLANSFKDDSRRTVDVAFSKDGRTLAVGHQERGFVLWDVSARKE